MEPWFAALARPTAAVPSAAAHNNALAWRTSRAGAACERSCEFRPLGPLPLLGLLVRPGTAKPIGDRKELVDRHVYHPRCGQDRNRGHPRPTSLPVIDGLP